MKFQQFDADANGLISRHEAHHVLKDELGFTESQTLNLIAQFDVNADGYLSYEEFIGFYLKVKDRSVIASDLDTPRPPRTVAKVTLYLKMADRRIGR